MAEDRKRFVVGIDYGTTYSGAAYLFVDPDKPHQYSEIKHIKSWPGGGIGIDNRTLDKAPTEISFEDGQTLWGYEIPQGTKRYSCFKLLLDEKASKTAYDDPNLPSGGDDALRPSLPDGKTAQDVTFEYLRLLYEHVIKHLREHIPSTFDITPIQFVLTVPAIWSHAAQRATRDSAKRAGFGSRANDTITIVSEPEAAGAYCLSEMHEGSANELKVGDRILICDAGGGTVDLATYVVSEIKPCLRVREAVTGSGGKCGSTAIDRAFLRWLNPLVTQQQQQQQQQKKKKKKKKNEKNGKNEKDEKDEKNEKNEKRQLRTGPGSTIMSCFESAKRSFGTSEHDQKWPIPLGLVEDDPKNGIEYGELLLTSNRMVEFFDPIVELVVDLAARQIKDANSKGGDSNASKILLVGGFAESRYLRKKLKEWCQSQPFLVDVISPMNAWTAVARGAVIHGIESLVDSRRLREHYGTIMAVPFDRRYYDVETSYFDPIYMCRMTNDHVAWFANMGQEAANGQHFSIGGCSRFPEWLDRKVNVRIVGSKLEDAPISAKRGKVYPVGLIEADLSTVPESVFNIEGRVSGPGGGEIKILHAPVSIEMSVASADLKFEVMIEGQSYGSTRIEYHHDGLSDIPSTD